MEASHGILLSDLTGQVDGQNSKVKQQFDPAAQVDAAPEFPEALDMLTSWLEQQGRQECVL